MLLQQQPNSQSVSDEVTDTPDRCSGGTAQTAISNRSASVSKPIQRSFLNSRAQSRGGGVPPLIVP